jgi:hypothetical protein
MNTMLKQKASPALVAAILRVQRSERIAAMQVAEKTFTEALSKLTEWNDFSHADHIEMAMEAAAAEVAYKFA